LENAKIGRSLSRCSSLVSLAPLAYPPQSAGRHRACAQKKPASFASLSTRFSPWVGHRILYSAQPCGFASVKRTSCSKPGGRSGPAGSEASAEGGRSARSFCFVFLFVEKNAEVRGTS